MFFFYEVFLNSLLSVNWWSDRFCSLAWKCQMLWFHMSFVSFLLTFVDTCGNTFCLSSPILFTHTLHFLYVREMCYVREREREIFFSVISNFQSWISQRNLWLIKDWYWIKSSGSNYSWNRQKWEWRKSSLNAQPLDRYQSHVNVTLNSVCLPQNEQ